MDISCIVTQITCTVNQTHAWDQHDQSDYSRFTHFAVLQLHKCCCYWYLYLFKKGSSQTFLLLQPGHGAGIFFLHGSIRRPYSDFAATLHWHKHLSQKWHRCKAFFQRFIRKGPSSGMLAEGIMIPTIRIYLTMGILLESVGLSLWGAGYLSRAHSGCRIDNNDPTIITIFFHSTIAWPPNSILRVKEFKRLVKILKFIQSKIYN